MRDSKKDSDIKNRLSDSGRRQGWDDLREIFLYKFLRDC